MTGGIRREEINRTDEEETVLIEMAGATDPTIALIDQKEEIKTIYLILTTGINSYSNSTTMTTSSMSF